MRLPCLLIAETEEKGRAVFTTEALEANTLLETAPVIVLRPVVLIYVKPTYLVPSARLELAQLSPLPPQDSVSTNFTTTAACFYVQNTSRSLRFLLLSTTRKFTLKQAGSCPILTISKGFILKEFVPLRRLALLALLPLGRAL